MRARRIFEPGAMQSLSDAINQLKNTRETRKVARTSNRRRVNKPVGATFYASTPRIKSLADAKKASIELSLFQKLMGIKDFKTAFETAKNRVWLNLANTEHGTIAKIRRYMKTGQECTSTVKKERGQSFKAFAAKVGESITKMGNKPEPEIYIA